MRYQVGARHEHFIKQGDQQRNIFADEFLVRVNGQQYRAADVLAIEILDKLRSLMSAHNGMNNFYDEWPPAWGGETARLRESAAPHAPRGEPRVLVRPKIDDGAARGVPERGIRARCARLLAPDGTHAHAPTRLLARIAGSGATAAGRRRAGAQNAGSGLARGSSIPTARAPTRTRDERLESSRGIWPELCGRARRARRRRSPAAGRTSRSGP